MSHTSYSGFLDILEIRSQSKPLLVWQNLVLVSSSPFVEDNPPHLPEREVSVWEEVPHLTIGVVDVVKQVPLDRVVLVISVAVDGGAEVIRHVPQLVGLVSGCQFLILQKKPVLEIYHSGLIQSTSPW